MLEEINNWPDWEPDLNTDDLLTTDFDREEEEWRLANGIIAGSNFVKEGLIACGVEPSKVHVVPYGIDSSRFPLLQDRPIRTTTPLRVLFVGSVGLRKGVPYLLKALAKLGPKKVQARFVGTVSLDPKRLEPFREVATFTGTVPRSEMAEMYQWADVFCLPSIVEGSATVTYEALMSGLAVITTPNTGSLVRDGIDGQLVTIRSHEALVEALDAYATNRDLLQQHSVAAVSARKRVGLDRYKNDLIALIKDFMPK